MGHICTPFVNGNRNLPSVDFCLFVSNRFVLGKDSRVLRSAVLREGGLKDKRMTMHLRPSSIKSRRFKLEMLFRGPSEKSSGGNG